MNSLVHSESPHIHMNSAVALSTATSRQIIRLLESSYIHVHILSISLLVASNALKLSGLAYHFCVADIYGLDCNSNTVLKHLTTPSEQLSLKIQAPSGNIRYRFMRTS